MPIPILIDETTATTGFSDVTARARSRLAALALPERVIPLAIVLAVVTVFAIGLRNDFVQ